MADETDSATEAVKKKLDTARKLAWDAFDSPSEDTVMTLFRQICIETELAQIEPAERPGAVVH